MVLKGEPFPVLLQSDFGVFLSMASNFQKTLGLYSPEEALYIQNNPDEYVYTNGKSDYEPTGTIQNEIGWAFILSLILKEGTKGVNNLVLVVLRYQAILEISIIILLFW